MTKNFVEELQWRGMIHDITPGTEEQLQKEMTTAYVGIDPTADSLHIGHLVSVMMLKHFQRAGHKPIVLVGGATGMIGDPSMKSAERNLLDEQTLEHNVDCLKSQLSKFLDFASNNANAAEMVNNYDWMRNFGFLEFIRDIGKHITVNYMMAKDSVKKRLSEDAKTGLSFTEFTYQLVQATDFLHLYREKNCRLQMGGSDQWGNITTGTELIRRKEAGEAFALTCPLITKADGGKFGKTESGNVWLDAKLTTPYKFFQFWLNVSDADAERYIKIFTMLGQDEIAVLVNEQAASPHLRPLQKRLAQEVTCMVHGVEEYDRALEASQVLFGNATTQSLARLDKETFLSVFEGVPTFPVERALLDAGVSIVELLATHTAAFPSKGDLRRTIQGNGLSLNKSKVEDQGYLVTAADLVGDSYVLVQKGKKNYIIIEAV
ncbi:MAG: tyrosine--tRNA ligase [Pelovirga sp.]